MGYTAPQLYVTKVGGITNAFGIGEATTNQLKIFANTIDTYPQIVLVGDAGAYYYIQNGTAFHVLTPALGDILLISHVDPDTIIENSIANKNIFLKTTGSGTVKFGTHTGSGDVACNGSIAITDSGGTARKLMTTA